MFPGPNKTFLFQIYSQHVQENGTNIVMLNILFLLYIIVCSIDKYHIKTAPLRDHCFANISHTIMPMTLVDLQLKHFFGYCQQFCHIFSLYLAVSCWDTSYLI